MRIEKNEDLCNRYPDPAQARGRDKMMDGVQISSVEYVLYLLI